MDSEFILLFFILFLVLHKLRVGTPTKYKFPPGPRGLPLLGNLLAMGEAPHKTFVEWGKTYGSVFTIQFGSHKAVVLNDEKAIKSAFSRHAFSGRAQLPLFVDSGEGKGILLTDGPMATEQRNFLTKNLKLYVEADKAIMESKCKLEIQEIISGFKTTSGEVIKMSHRFQRSIVNVIWSLLLGERFENGDARLSSITAAIKRLTSQNDSILTNLAIVVAPISNFIPEYSGYNSIVRAFRGVYKFIEKTSNFPNAIPGRIPGRPRNYKEAYMDKMEATEDTNSSFHKSGHQFNRTTGDVFLASMETISSSMDFFFIHMIHYPRVYKKLFDEIQSVVGSSEEVSLKHRPKMVYTQAVILESLRFSPLLPMGVYHRTVEDVHFQDYYLPANTVVISNLYGANYDPVVWGDPVVYRPERFIDEDTRELKRNGPLLSFSYGKRVCPGERLAWDFMFLFITNVLQQLDIELPPNEPLPSLNGEPGLVFAPRPYNLIFRER